MYVMKVKPLTNESATVNFKYMMVYCECTVEKTVKNH